MDYNYQDMPQYRGMDGYAEYLAKQANPHYRESYTPRHDPVVNDSYWASEAGYNMSQRDPDNSLQSAYDSYVGARHGMNDDTDARLLALQQEKASLEKEIATLQREINRMQSDVDFSKKYADDPLYKSAVETYVRTGNMGDLNTFRQYQDALAQRGQAERTNRETWLAKYGAANNTLTHIGKPNSANIGVYNAALAQRDEAERQLRLMGIDAKASFGNVAPAANEMGISAQQYSEQAKGLTNNKQRQDLIQKIMEDEAMYSGGKLTADAEKVVNELNKAINDENDRAAAKAKRKEKYEQLKAKFASNSWDLTDDDYKELDKLAKEFGK